MAIIQSSSSENNISMRLAWTVSDSTSFWEGLYFSVDTAVTFKICFIFPKVIIWIFPIKFFSYLAGDATCASASLERLVQPAGCWAPALPSSILRTGNQVERSCHCAAPRPGWAPGSPHSPLPVAPTLVFQIRSLSFLIPSLNRVCPAQHAKEKEHWAKLKGGASHILQMFLWWRDWLCIAPPHRSKGSHLSQETGENAK